MNETFLRFARMLLPEWLKEELKAQRMIVAARRQRAQSIRPTLAETAAAACVATLPFTAGQRSGEITRLLKLLQPLRPKTLCEIGSASGGNLFLFSRIADPEALLVSVDFELERDRERALPSLLEKKQSLIFVRGDSQAPATVQRVRTALAGRPLDFLFIDADHSLEGVSRDFHAYSPLVRPGGLIAFHDVVPDAMTRFGIRTKSIAGGVPLFWERLKQQHPQAQEIIDDPDQDGFGIGVLEWKGDGAQ